MHFNICMKVRVLNSLFFPAAVFLLLATAPCWGFGSEVLRSAPPQVKACMEGKLGAEAMEKIRNGERIRDKAARGAVRQAYEECSGSAGGDVSPRYRGPLFDAMAQIDETVDMDKAMARVREAGVGRIALFARSRKRLHQNEEAVFKLAERNPDLIVLGAPKYFQLSGDVSRDYIRATADGIQGHGYRFVGELLYTHGDKRSGKRYAAGERYVDPSRSGTRRLLKALAPLKVPFMTHWEPYAPERDFPRFHALYAAWPDQVFLLPHMGFASADQLASFLEKHPNLYALTSKKERYMGDFADPGKQSSIGEAMLDGTKLRPEWRALLIRFQDRILFATDPHMRKLWRRYGETVERQRLILGQLPGEVAEKIAYRNAEKVYGVTVGE